MLLKKARGRILALISAGAIPFKDTRVDVSYLDSLLNGGRVKAIQLRVASGHPIHPEWLLPYEPSFSPDYQNGVCYTEFPMIPTIAIGSYMDGVSFVGTGLKAYHQVNSRATLSSRNDDRIMKPGAREGEVDVLFEGGKIKCYSKTNIQDIQLMLIPADPFDCPTWNPDVDQYPITEDLMMDIEKVLSGPDLQMIMKGVYDRLPNNGKDETVQSLPATPQ